MTRFIDARSFRLLALFMALFMWTLSFVPRAEAGFVASQALTASETRSRDTATVERVLQNKVVKQRLQELGYSDQEVRDRLAGLSDQELNQLAGRIDTVAPAGDGFGFVIGLLVVAILVVILLILADKRVSIH
ncbi:MULTISPECIES: PA2779 family protein [Desulfovibrio]|jgi:tetrahydromethanopterin S-methyltransferase subunit B|uniref:PA2779 family protein n=1 Tax=Desulfovibrio TaxID=872 RepID=UPI000400473B|nr:MULTISPECIES: PA2779 family protein [Desulfovibrio]MDY0305659.1 PA2779 family protein [Desulfovibrionaceae bacterium]HMM40199.1 PA2779 family protein [Desulfovibrio sp.]